MCRHTLVERRLVTYSSSKCTSPLTVNPLFGSEPTANSVAAVEDLNQKRCSFFLHSRTSRRSLLFRLGSSLVFACFLHGQIFQQPVREERSCIDPDASSGGIHRCIWKICMHRLLRSGGPTDFANGPPARTLRLMELALLGCCSASHFGHSHTHAAPNNSKSM